MKNKIYRRLALFLLINMMFSICMPVMAASDEMESFKESEEKSTKEMIVEKNIWKGEVKENNRVYLDEKGEKVTGLQKINDKFYLFDNGGIVQTGWQKVEGVEYYFSQETGERYEERVEEIDGIKYSFNKEGKYRVAEEESVKQETMPEIEESGMGTEIISEDDSSDIEHKIETPIAETVQTGWISDGENRYFADHNGVVYRNQIITFGNIWYYMGEDGSVQLGYIKAANGSLYYGDLKTGILKKAGWIEIDGKRYFANERAELYKNRFIKFGDIYYYMGSDGSVQKGVVQTIDGVYYADPETGIIQNQKVGWMEIGGESYFISPNGRLYSNQIITFGDIWYYMGPDGSVQKGYKKAIDGTLYYGNPETGILKRSGWIEIGGKRYFANERGSLYKNQIITFGDIGYCMGADGSVQYGAVTLNGITYYTDEITGIIQKKTGWIEKNGKKYFANEAGILYRNQIITFGDVWYCMGDDGSVQYGIGEAGGKLYHTDEQTGIVIKVAGWIEKDENRYFSNSQGILYRNQFISFGSTYYYCGVDGAICYGSQVINGIKYLFDETGIMIKEFGWGENEGKKYYKNPATGFPYKNQWVTFGQVWYYADMNGLMVSGWHEINGARYYFYPETFVMARNVSIDGWEIGSDGKAGSAQYLQKKMDEIKKYVSVPYQTGGTTPLGWDCSGFTMWALKYLGVNIPRLSFEQAVCGTAIDKNDMSKWKPGDILVYSSGGYAGHVALYLGDGMLMHALNYRWGTLIQGVEYYEKWDSGTTLTGVRRYL